MQEKHWVNKCIQVKWANDHTKIALDQLFKQLQKAPQELWLRVYNSVRLFLPNPNHNLSFLLTGTTQYKINVLIQPPKSDAIQFQINRLDKKVLSVILNLFYFILPNKPVYTIIYLEILDFVDVYLFVLFLHGLGAGLHSSYSILRVLERLNCEICLQESVS